MFNFLQQQDPNIDPRAAYEQQSILADTLLRNSQQYQGGGAIGALAMIANAFAANRMGNRAQGSLSAALEREQQKAMAEQKEEQERRRLAEKREMERIIALRNDEDRRRKLDAKNQPTTQETMDAEFADWQRRQQWLIDNAPEEPQSEGVQLPPIKEAAIARANQLREEGLMTDEEHMNAVNEIYGVPMPEEDGGVPDDATTRNALGKLNQAQASLEDYKRAAFKLDGWDGQGAPDYRELPNFSVDRGGILENSIQNLLYAKSGASAPQSEVESYKSQFEPGMFSTDAANWDRIQRLEQDIQSQRNALLGRGGDAPTANDGGASAAASTGDPQQVLQTLRQANPGVSDADLAAYARQQGYIQ